MMKHLLRRLFNSKLFSLAAILSVVCGAGVALGLVAVVGFLSPAASGIPDFQHLVHFVIGDGPVHIPFSAPAYRSLQAQAGFGDLAIWDSSGKLAIQTEDGTHSSTSALVNGDFFKVMQLRPELGNFFTERDDRPDGGPFGWSVVLGYRYWETRYHKDAHIIGTTMTIDNTPVRVVGVLPKSFSGMNPPEVVDLLLPSQFLDVLYPSQHRSDNPGIMEWEVYGRLAPQRPIGTVEALLSVVEPAVRKAADPDGGMLTNDNFPGLVSKHLLAVHPAQLEPSYGMKALKTPLLVTQVLTFTLVALCAFSVFFLFLSRNAGRERELAVRLALGAPRRTILSLLMSESFVLGVLGGIGSIPVSRLVAHLLSTMVASSDGLSSFPQVRPSAAMEIATAAIAAVTCALLGLMASLSSGREETSLTRQLTRVARTRPVTKWIVGCEIALSISLTGVAASSIAGLKDVLSRPSGFSARQTVTASVELNPQPANDGEADKVMQRIFSSVASSPGIRAVAFTSLPPLSGATARGGFATRRADEGYKTSPNMWPVQVSYDYFNATGTSIVRGRNFTQADAASTPVCIISNGSARDLFGQADPIDRELYRVGDHPGSFEQYCRVIGVSEDAHFTSLATSPEEAVYLLTPGTFGNLIVKGQSAELAMHAIHRAVMATAPASVVSNMASMDEHISADLRLANLVTLFAAILAGFTVGIMGIGLFSILAIEVTRARRELGVRLALGSSKRALCLSLLGKFRGTLVCGAGAGILASLLVVGQVSSAYAVKGFVLSAGYMLGTAVVLLAVACAIYVPFRRALGVPPASCLKAE